MLEAVHGAMSVGVLIHAIFRQTTILIAQLATSQGLRAPLAQIADQVFVDLARELERQGVSRKVSADMFGLGLRTYRRKLQRLNESRTERGRSLWEVVLEFVKGHSPVTRTEVLARFPADDESQVRAVLYDLCESELLHATGTGLRTSYRVASSEELSALHRTQGPEGEDDLLLALMYREGALTLNDVAALAQSEPAAVAERLARLQSNGRIEVSEVDGEPRYRARALGIPLGSSAGWEAAVFDHYKALVMTVLSRLRDPRSANLEDGVGGSTYTIDVWPGHPLEDEVRGTLSRMRATLSDLRSRVTDFNADQELPERHTRAVIYVGQCLIDEDNKDVD